jgi:hypothetical protein
MEKTQENIEYEAVDETEIYEVANGGDVIVVEIDGVLYYFTKEK